MLRHGEYVGEVFRGVMNCSEEMMAKLVTFLLQKEAERYGGSQSRLNEEKSIP